MRKKRFLSCLLVILLLAVFSVTLVACQERVSQIVTPDAVATKDMPGVGELLLIMLEGMGNKEDFVSMDFDSVIKTNLNTKTDENGKPVGDPIWDYRRFYLKGNFKPDSGDLKGDVELGLGVIATDENGNEKPDKSQNFEIFLKNGRFYLRAAGTSLYLEDIDFNWLIEQLRKIGGLQNLVDTIIGLTGLDLGDGASTKVNDLIGIVAMLIFQVDTKVTTYNKDSKTGHIALKFNPDQLIDTVVKAIGNTSIDGILEGVGMRLMLPDGEGGMKPYSLDNFLKTLHFPNINVYVEADVENGKLVMTDENNAINGLQLHVYDYKTDYFQMNTGVIYDSENGIEILPKNIEEFKPFGLLKFQFDTSIELEAKKVDVGKLVNFFAGSTFLPENSLIIDAEANITIKLDVDLRLKEEENSLDDKSIFLLEIFGDNKEEPMAGLYLRNNKIYINLDDAIKTENGNIDIKPGNIVVDGVTVTKWVSHALSLATDAVEQLMDEFFGKKSKSSATTFAEPVSDIQFKDGYSLDDFVLTIGHNDEGEAYVSKTMGTILDIIRYTIGFEEFIIVNENNDGRIYLNINNKFFHKLCSQFNINVKELAEMQDFGVIQLGIDLAKESAFFTLDLGKAVGADSSLNASIVVSNFRYGFSAREILMKKIEKATDGRDYIGNVKDLIYNAVDDLDFEFGAKLHLDKGVYNAANILGIDTKLPSVNITVDDAFDLELILKIQVQMDEVFVGYEKDENGNRTDIEIYEKVISRAYISITNVSSNPIFPVAGMTVRLYYLDDRYEPNGALGIMPITRENDKVHGTLYADMSEFNMIQIGIPSFAIGIDLTDLIFSMLGDLDIDFKIPDILNKDNNSGAGQGATQSYSSSNGIRTVKGDDSQVIYALFNTATAEQTDRILKLQLTSALIKELLKIFDLNIGFELPEINIDAEINKINGITLSIKTWDPATETEDKKLISLDLGVNKFRMGVNVDVNVDKLLEDIQKDSNKFGVYIKVDDLSGGVDKGFLKTILDGIIYRALDDVDIKFNLAIHLDPGTYNINNILGINTGLPSIPIESSEGFDLKFELSIQLQSAIVPKTDIMGNIIEGEYEQIISRAMITLQNKAQNPITPKGNGVVKLMYFDDRYEGNAEFLTREGYQGLKPYKAVKTGTDSEGNDVYRIEKTHGTLLLNLSTFNILNFELPDVALDVDLTQIIEQVIGSINLSDVAFSNDAATATESAVKSLIAQMADGDNETTEQPEKVSYIKIALTTELIEQVLKMVGANLSFTLPEIDGGIIVDATEGIYVDIATQDGNKNITAKIGMNKLHLGTHLDDSDIILPEDFASKIKNFGSPADLTLNNLLSTVIYRALDDVDLSFGLAFNITKGTYNVGKLLSMFGLDFGDEPINIDVSQDFVLDLTMRIQIRWNDFVGEYANGGSGITQARISLYNKTPNILFPTGSETEPVLDVHYFDDRGPNNNTIPPLVNNFWYGMNGKKTHGSLFVNLSGFEFAKLKLPSMVIDMDLTKVVKDLVDNLNLSDESIISTAEMENMMTTYVASAFAAAVNTEENVTEDEGNYLRIYITMSFLKDLLARFGVGVVLPPLFDSLEGDFTISQINGIRLFAKVTGTPEEGTEGNAISLDLSIKHIRLGKETTINLPGSYNIYGTELVSDLGSVIYRILDDTDIEIKLTADVPAGKYNLAPLLSLAGIKIDKLFMEFTESFNLDLALKIQLQMETVQKTDKYGNKIDGTETVLARALIEIVSGTDNKILGFKANQTVAKVYYFDDRFEENMNKPNLRLKPYSYDDTNGQTKSHGTLFADFSGLKIANIAIPPINMDIDLTTVIQSVAASLSDSINLGTATASETFMTRTLAAIADNDNSIPGTPALGNYIKVNIATGLINEILAMLDVNIGFELPEFNVDIAADADKGIAIVLNLDTKDFNVDGDVTNHINAMLSFPQLHLGINNTVDIPQDFLSDYYSTDFSNLVQKLLRYGELKAKVNISANSSTINVQRLLNNILAASGMTITLPINVDLNDFANELDLTIKWAFDYANPTNTLLEVKLECDGNTSLGIYLKNGNVYVDLSGLGLPKFVLENSGLAELITNLVGKSLDGILGGLINSGTSGLQGAVATANNMSVADMNSQLFAMALDGDIEAEEDKPFEIMDYVSLLLKGLSMSDGVFNINITEEMMRTLLKELSINIAEDISVNGSLDLFKGNMVLDITFDQIRVAMDFSVVNIGGENNIQINEGGGYEVLNMGSANLFVNSLFNALDPGIWIDIISKNYAITDTNFRYTKITMEKVPMEGMSLNYTNGGWANGGSILIKILRMDGGGRYFDSVNGVPALYVILDINAKKINIRGTTELLPIDVFSLHADQMVNIYIDFDIKKILSDLIGPIITQIKDAGTSTTADNNVATTGIEDVFKGFSIDSLLRGINIKIYGVKNIKINVELNHNMVNDLVPNLINSFNGMKIELQPGKNSTVISGLNYTNGRGTNFLDNLYNNLVLPVVKVAVEDAGFGGAWAVVKGLVDDYVKDNLLNLVSRLLPMPQFTELNANVYIVNGMLDNIQVIGYDNNSSSGNDKNRLELRIFNDMSQQAFFGYMDALDLNNARFQSPYIHFDSSVDSAVNFANKFEQNAYAAQKLKMYYNAVLGGDNWPFIVDAATVNWEITYYNSEDFDLDNNLPSGDMRFTISNMNAFKEYGGAWRSGYYKATGTAIVGTKTYSTTVRVVIEDNTSFINHEDTTVDKIEVRSGRGLPDTITLTNKTLNRSINIRNVAGATDKFTLIDAEQLNIYDHTRNAQVRIKLANGTNKTLPVEIHWHDANLSLVETAPIEISIFDFMDFYNNYYTAEKMLVLTSDGRRIYQDVESISITSGRKQLFNIDSATGNITSLANLTEWENETGFETELTIKLKNTHQNQKTLTRKVIVKPRIVDYVRFDSRNTIIMDTVQNESDLPKQVRVYFKNGDSGVYSIDYNSWDFSKITSSSTARAIDWDKGGVYDNVFFKFTNDYDKIKGTTPLNLVGNITLVINESVIDYAKVGPDNGERYCNISYEDFANKNFNDLDLRLISSDGKVTDYQDKVAYTISYKKPVEYGEDGSVTSPEDIIMNDAAGRATLAAMSEAQRNKYEAVIGYALNYEIIDRGITLGDKGGRARVTVRLLNLKVDSTFEKPKEDASRVKTTFLYFEVAAPIVRVD